MTSESATPPAGRYPPTSARARPLAFQGLANTVVRALLRTPLIASAIGGRLITLYLVGRKSGKHYEIPVAYTRDGRDLLIGTPFGWGKNLRTGEPVDILLKGKRRTADVQVITDEAGVTAHFAAMARDNRQFAKFNQIGIGADGSPDPAHLRAAWAAGARGFRLTPR
jgi:deazaflavin-dependent oxidoreductase (nitroreductase family)